MMILAQFRMFPETASTLAEEVDALFFFILAVTLFFTLLIAGLVITFILRYRRRSNTEIPQGYEGSLTLEIFWTVVPTIIALVIFAWGARVFMFWAEPPEDTLEVYVVGHQWMWKIQHPGGQSEINQLHVPVGRPVRVTLTSKDVIHSFFVPAFRLHMDAVPGRYTTTWFEATKTGEFDLYCSEFCGTNHSVMIGKVIVMTPEAYQDWLTERADHSLAARGRQLFQKLQCVACHSADERAVAPTLENVFLKQAPLHDGRFVLADDDYLRESIREPNAKIVAGFQAPSIMPPYGPDVVDEEEMIQLLAFLRSLGPGQTPKRVEEFAPPIRTEEPKKDKKS